MWFQLMMAAFVFNGLCTFGLRILADMGLAKDFTIEYLVFWYLGGAAAMLAAAIPGGLRLRRPDVLIGGALGVFSSLGQSLLGAALATGLPGNVVFPVSLAGGLFLVVLAGVSVFKEKVGPAGMAGIALGVISIVLLSVE